MDIVGKVIGRGQKSIVYLHKTDDGKVLKNVWNSDEYDILVTSNHSNIIKPYGYLNTYENENYIILPKLKHIDTSITLNQIEELVDTLKYLYDMGINYKDIHIDNIMTDGEKLIFIDFDNVKKRVNPKNSSYKKYLKYNLNNLAITFIYHLIMLNNPELEEIEDYDEIFNDLIKDNFNYYGDVGRYLFQLI